MASRLSLPCLSFSQRFQIFSQLAAMEKAGLPADKAFSLLKLPRALHARVVQTQKLLCRGIPISKAGGKTQLFTKLEASLLGAASHAGRLDAIYLGLSNYYRERAAQGTSMKAKLIIPGFLLVACFFINPLPALLAGNVSFSNYFLTAIKPFAPIACSIGIFFAIRSRISGACPAWLDRFFLRAPIYGPVYIRANTRDFFETLALLLDAGIPILEALPQAVRVIQNPDIRTAFSSIEPAIRKGQTLFQAVHSNPYMQKSAARALIETGEASGAFSEMLFRWAAMETETLRAFHKNVAEWLPRCIYAAIVGWTVRGFF